MCPERWGEVAEDRVSQVLRGRGLSAGGFVGDEGEGESGFTAAPENSVSVSFRQPAFSLSAFWFSSMHLLCFLPSQPVLLTHRFYPPVISAGCSHASPALCLLQLSAVLPASAHGSFPLNAFAQTPGRIWSFLTPRAIDH